MTIQQLSVFIEDKKGRLTELTKILSESNINILAFSIADAVDYGIVRMIVSDTKNAERILKEHHFSVHITDVVCIIIPDKPGELYNVLQLLSSNNISVDYVYAFVIEKQASVAIRSSSNQDVIRLLKENNMDFTNGNDMYQIE